jgi:MurNAc alpha-1-phosphate uridylyltransferase
MLHRHLKGRAAPRLHFSFEEELLETGGGIRAALGTLGGAPFYVVSGDSLWTDGPNGSALERIAQAWDGDKMDLLLLLQPVAGMTLTPGRGDYDLNADGRAVRSLDRTGAYMWTSIRICAPRLFDGAPDGPFSFLDLMDRAQAQGRLYGLVHDAEWHHITTGADLERVNAALAARKRA